MVDDFTLARRKRRATQIAREVDPMAGDFFHRMLVNAALRGMAEGDDEEVADGGLRGQPAQ